MGDKITIPTADLKAYERQYFGAGKQLGQIAVGKTIAAMPGPYSAVTENLLYPPSAADLIKDYLLYKAPPDPVAKPIKEYNIPKNSAVMQSVGGAALNGQPLVANIVFGGEYGQKGTDFSGRTYGFPSMTFNTVIIRTQQQKNIAETQIQGSDDGAVLEYSGLNNYNVDIDIIVVGSNANGIYPRDEMDNLVKMLTAPVPIKVTSWYLQMLGIFELVVKDYTIDQVEGGISQQPVTINCISNRSTTLIIQ